MPSVGLVSDGITDVIFVSVRVTVLYVRRLPASPRQVRCSIADLANAGTMVVTGVSVC